MIDRYIKQRLNLKVYYQMTGAYEKTKDPQKTMEDGTELDPLANLKAGLKLLEESWRSFLASIQQNENSHYTLNLQKLGGGLGSSIKTRLSPRVSLP